MGRHHHEGRTLKVGHVWCKQEPQPRLPELMMKCWSLRWLVKFYCVAVHSCSGISKTLLSPLYVKAAVGCLVHAPKIRRRKHPSLLPAYPGQKIPL